MQNDTDSPEDTADPLRITRRLYAGEEIPVPPKSSAPVSDKAREVHLARNKRQKAMMEKESQEQQPSLNVRDAWAQSRKEDKTVGKRQRRTRASRYI